MVSRHLPFPASYFGGHKCFYMVYLTYTKLNKRSFLKILVSEAIFEYQKDKLTREHFLQGDQLMDGVFQRFFDWIFFSFIIFLIQIFFEAELE